jgi:hypothetical protein
MKTIHPHNALQLFIRYMMEAAERFPEGFPSDGSGDELKDNLNRMRAALCDEDAKRVPRLEEAYKQFQWSRFQARVQKEIRRDQPFSWHD